MHPSIRVSGTYFIKVGGRGDLGVRAEVEGRSWSPPKHLSLVGNLMLVAATWSLTFKNIEVNPPRPLVNPPPRTDTD